ncbi:MAG: alkaline phosphatase family protein [Acholeplasmataceae bacterium]
MKNLVDEKHSIVNVSKSILKHYGCYQQEDTITELDHYLAEPSDHVIYLLLDGLGMNALKLHLDQEAILRRHLLRTVTSVFPPTTVAATHAVLAAKPPIETGYLGWIQYDPLEDLNLEVFLNTDFYTGKSATRNYREEALPYVNLLERVKDKNPRVETFELFPDFIPGGSKTFGEHLDRLDHIMRTHGKTFSYVYWVEPDLSQHRLGTKHPEVTRIIRDLDHQIAAFTAVMPERVRLIVIADHGLIDVRPIALDQDEVLFSYLRRKPSLEPRATNFFVKHDHLKDFERHFHRHYGAYYELYSRTRLFDERILGTGKPHGTLKATLGDFVAIATKDRMFTLKEKTPFKAHHAGMTSEEVHVPLILYMT